MDDAPEHPSPADVQRLLDARGPIAERARIDAVAWSSRFRVHHRVAARVRQGRILLCGDAAHVHSPAGGQGMNTGIQDAVSLAEVLAGVIAGRDESALDAWAVRRHAVAEGVVRLTDRITRLATLRSPLARTLRNAAIRQARHFPGLRRALARNIAELNDR